MRSNDATDDYGPGENHFIDELKPEPWDCRPHQSEYRRINSYPDLDPNQRDFRSECVEWVVLVLGE